MATVTNFDIAGVGDRTVQFAEELLKSQSAGQAEFNVHDRGRATAHCDRVLSFLTLVTADPNPLDLPKTHPTSYPVRDFLDDDAVDSIENTTVKDVVRRWKAAHTEAVGSQSADRASGVQAQDLGRLVALIEAIKLLVEFGADTPDIPEAADAGKVKGKR